VSRNREQAGNQRGLSGQENLAGWHGSRQVVRKAEAFSLAGRQASIVERKQDRHRDARTQAGRHKLAGRNREEQAGKQ
jgi:hypothetical protein